MGFVILVGVATGLIALVVYSNKQFGPKERSETLTVRGSEEDVLDDLAISLHRVDGAVVERLTSNSVTLTSERYPAGVIVVAVLLFPIGLLALLSKKKRTSGTVKVVAATEGMSTLQISGMFDGAGVKRVNDVVERRS